jgi:hypothetical protein
MTGNYTIDTKTSEKFEQKVDKKAFVSIVKITFQFPSLWKQYLTSSCKLRTDKLLPSRQITFCFEAIERASLSTPSTVSQLNSFCTFCCEIFFQAAWFPPHQILFFPALNTLKCFIKNSKSFYQLCLNIKS